jgi:hypothetical protein
MEDADAATVIHSKGQINHRIILPSFEDHLGHANFYFLILFLKFPLVFRILNTTMNSRELIVKSVLAYV